VSDYRKRRVFRALVSDPARENQGGDLIELRASNVAQKLVRTSMAALSDVLCLASVWLLPVQFISTRPAEAAERS
jgi:hypothetical protein